MTFKTMLPVLATTALVALALPGFAQDKTKANVDTSATGTNRCIAPARAIVASNRDGSR